MAYEKVIVSEAYRALVCRMCGDDFEDLCQQARVKVLLMRERIDEAHNPTARCRRIARNEMCDWLRREARHELEPLPVEP